MQLDDLTGRLFGRIRVVERWPSNKGQTFWHCLCECGTVRIVNGRNLKNGQTQSCGCFARENTSRIKRKHGKSGTPAYGTWAGMIGRCNNPNNQDYQSYGGRGIQVCGRWLSFVNFIADMGPRPSSRHSIDRRNNNGNYEPSNCRWAIPVEQSNNRRSSRIVIWDGVPQTLAELVRAKGVPYSRTMNRLRSGWSLDAAITAPTNANKVRARQ